MSSERTGFAQGSLKPCIYYERADGFIVLAPAEKGDDTLARAIYEKKYAAHGWEWRECRTLHDLDKLEKRLIAQEEKQARKMIEANAQVRTHVRDAVRWALKERMVQQDTSNFEKQFIEAYLKLHDEKRDKFRDALLQHNWGIMARNYDSTKKVEDLI
jgi:hypothetical protein